MPRLAPIVLPLADALNCVCAEDVHAARPVPAFDTCARDGFAVCANDSGELRIIDEVPAGFISEHTLTPGSTIRVAAGAQLPQGAAAVLPWSAATQTLHVKVPGIEGDGVLRTGHVLANGAIVCQANTFINPEAIARLASSGHATVLVHPRPRVVIVPVGTELARAGETVRAGVISDAVGPMLLAEARLNEADAYLADPVRDDDQAVLEAIEEAQLRADVILTSGGLGVLEGGAVARTLNTSGGVATFNELPVIALPGDPALALEVFRSTVSPLIQELRGVTEL